MAGRGAPRGLARALWEAGMAPTGPGPRPPARGWRPAPAGPNPLLGGGGSPAPDGPPKGAPLPGAGAPGARAVGVPVVERPRSVDEAMAAGTAPVERCGERIARLIGLGS